MRHLALIGLLIVTTLVYAPVRANGFVYEDSNAIWQHAGVLGQQPIDIGRARWLTAVSHRVVFTYLGHEPKATHLVNLGLHLVNGVLVYVLAIGVGSTPAAWIAAAVFLLSPLQTEAVAYAASRSELLSTLFALLAFWLAVSDRRWWRTGLMWALVLAAVCAKESTAVVVPLIAIADLCRGRRLPWWRLSWLALPAVAIAASVLRFDYTTRTNAGPLAYLALQATAVWRYIGLILVPSGLTVDHDFVPVPGAIQALALIALGVAVCTVLIAWFTSVTLSDEDEWTPGRVAIFGVAWALVALLPRFVVQIPEMLNEHQMYFPMVGLSLAIGAGLAAWVAGVRGSDAAGMVPSALEWM